MEGNITYLMVRYDFTFYKFSGRFFECRSADRTLEVADQCRFPVEYLNTLNPSGLPPHMLQLKPGCLIILLRNPNPIVGVCNGAWLILIAISRHSYLEATLIGLNLSGSDVLIPRINLTTEQVFDMPVIWVRRQFPIRPAFAMTINKSQGQTFDKVGLYLEEPVFSHGQLYVVLSRCSSAANLKIFLPPKDDGTFWTKNVVDKKNF